MSAACSAICTEGAKQRTEVESVGAWIHAQSPGVPFGRAIAALCSDAVVASNIQ